MTIDERLDKIEERLDKIDSDLSRWRGFIGGVVFIVSCVWAFLSMAGPVLLKKLGLG